MMTMTTTTTAMMTMMMTTTTMMMMMIIMQPAYNVFGGSISPNIMERQDTPTRTTRDLKEEVAITNYNYKLLKILTIIT